MPAVVTLGSSDLFVSLASRCLPKAGRQRRILSAPPRYVKESERLQSAGGVDRLGFPAQDWRYARLQRRAAPAKTARSTPRSLASDAQAHNPRLSHQTDRPPRHGLVLYSRSRSVDLGHHSPVSWEIDRPIRGDIPDYEQRSQVPSDRHRTATHSGPHLGRAPPPRSSPFEARPGCPARPLNGAWHLGRLAPPIPASNPLPISDLPATAPPHLTSMFYGRRLASNRTGV